ncbi:MAG: hypothetical protein IT210_20540 [Armatimonadetes bacterium]|nr:hypothetical protein [Armatimonadota bacterium]
MKKRFLIPVAISLMVQAAAWGQFGMQRQPEKPAWEQFKLNPKARVRLDFRNASVDAVTRLLSQASGVAIIKDPGLNFPITLQSPGQQTLTDAFAMLDTVLGLKNYGLRKEGNFLVIRPGQSRPQGGGFRPSGMPEGMSSGGGRSDGMQLRVYTVKYASASQVARVINEVFALPQAPQAGQPQPAQPDSNAGGGFRRGGRRGGASNTVSLVKASADDFSNSLIVNAPGRELDQVADLIEQIDKPTEQPQQSKVFALQYANAVDLAPILQNVLLSSAPRGRGGMSASSTPIDQRFQRGPRFGAMLGAFGTVVAEQRTNSLVVTATQDNLEVVTQVVKELDKEVIFENSAFVLTLQNARADAVAQLLNQSFSGRGGGAGGNLGGTRFGNRNQTQQRRNNRNNQNRFNGGGGQSGRSAAAGAASRAAADDENSQSEMDISLADPDAESGELETRVSVEPDIQMAQLPGGFGGGFRPQQQGRAATGFDESGRVVNVRDLTGTVTVIPDISTNSVIIVTPPENKEILDQVLAQLDKIPEQVMIETLIVEASLDATNKLGVEWNFIKGKSVGSQSFGLRADTQQPQGLRYTLSGADYSVFLQALQSDNRFEVLSTPRIFTSNNATAEINISQSLPYVTNQRVDANGNFIYNYAFLDVGIVLNVTPRITSNGYVTMDVVQTANDFVRYTDFNAPVVNQREAQTTVSVKDGETVVLGGIIKNGITATVNKVPLLGDIPILGNLFKSRSTTKNKTELLVFLTPRVVRDSLEAARLREETAGKLLPKTLERVKKALPAPAPEPAQPETKPQDSPEQEKPS